MTLYHGGKQRIGKELANIIYETSLEISEDENFKIKGYCEPFCGMLGVYRHIPELFKDNKPKLKYKAGDINESVIMMWKAAQKGWKPPISCSEDHYNDLKKNKNPSAEKGFLGHQLGFSGQFFHGYSPNYGIKINILKSASERVFKISQNLKDVNFRYGSYTQYSNLKGYVIYCDPPYTSSTQFYKNSFDTKKFWEWCNMMSKNNIIFISEYNAPKKRVKKIFEKKNYM
jgi:DNA adenine methylase